MSRVVVAVFIHFTVLDEGESLVDGLSGTILAVACALPADG